MGIRSIAGFISLAALGSAPAPAAACLPDLSQADAVLELHIADRALSGAGLAVFTGDGTNHHERYFGDYTPDTYVPLASASKAVSAAAIMSLVDDGTLSLDDTIAAYLPQYGGTPQGAITVRQAFSQTAGLWNEEWPCIGDAGTTLAACASEILDDVPRIAPPGAMFFYGGNSMHVAGRIAEIAYCRRFPANCTGLGSGGIWRRIFNERIRDPLGMGMIWNSATNPRIAGGLFSRLSDYRKFWRMLMNRGVVDGVRVLSEEAVDAMTRDQTGGAVVFYSAAQPGIRYGLGIWRFHPDATGGARVLSDPGKFGFHPWHDVATGVGGIVMLNDPGGAAVGGGRHIATQIEDLVHARFMSGDADADGDGICDAADDCVSAHDPSQADADADGAGDACDCASGDRRLWSPPGYTGHAMFYGPPTCLTAGYDPVTGQITCFPTRNLFDWLQPDAPGAVATDLRYDVLRTPVTSDFVAAALCEYTAIDRTGPFNDAYLNAAPPPGGIFAYLSRAANGCGPGPAGMSGDAEVIAARSCP